MKRKMVSMVLAFCLTVGGANCVYASGDDTDTRIQEIKTQIAELEKELAELQGQEDNSKDNEILLGDTITTDSYELTLLNVEFSYDVIPQTTSTIYSHYPADSGHVYIHVDADVKNIQKQDIACDDIYTVTADYDNGYTYNGFSFVEESDGDFTYSLITSIAPLQTTGVHYLIDCPQEVDTSDKPLFITFVLNDGTQYKYTIR